MLVQWRGNGHSHTLLVPNARIHFMRLILLHLNNLNGLWYRSPISTNKGNSYEALEKYPEMISISNLVKRPWLRGQVRTTGVSWSREERQLLFNGAYCLQGPSSRFFMLLAGFTLHDNPDDKILLSSPEHTLGWQRGWLLPVPLTEPGMEPGNLGTFSYWWQNFSKGTEHVLLKWLISALPIFTLLAAGSQAQCLFPLPQRRLGRELEAEAVWTLCFFHPLWRLKLMEMYLVGRKGPLRS